MSAVHARRTRRREEADRRAASRRAGSHPAKTMWLSIGLAGDWAVGTLEDGVIARMGVTTQARVVQLHPAPRRHIMARRQVASQGDAVIIAERLGEALHAVSYIVTLQRKPNVFEVVGFVPSANRYLGIVIKLVAAPRAKTGQDEWWVQTAYPFGKRTLRQLGRAGRLSPVPEGGA